VHAIPKRAPTTGAKGVVGTAQLLADGTEVDNGRPAERCGLVWMGRGIDMPKAGASETQDSAPFVELPTSLVPESGRSPSLLRSVPFTAAVLALSPAKPIVTAPSRRNLHMAPASSSQKGLDGGRGRVESAHVFMGMGRKEEPRPSFVSPAAPSGLLSQMHLTPNVFSSWSTNEAEMLPLVSVVL
jgi:hypothetical protein